MENESDIVRLLTEIRDNQQRQLDAHQKSQLDYLQFYNAAQSKQNRRALVVAIVVALGIAMLIFSLTMK